MGSVAMFSHPTRINMSYKLNTYVIFAGSTKSHPKQSREQNVLEVKVPISFFLEPRLLVPKMLFTMSDSYDCSYREGVSRGSLSLSEEAATFFGNMGNHK